MKSTKILIKLSSLILAFSSLSACAMASDGKGGYYYNGESYDYTPSAAAMSGEPYSPEDGDTSGEDGEQPRPQLAGGRTGTVLSRGEAILPWRFR